jgi:acyl-[acyl carrier protein]--UDP-N-acetylglucosamine O-acyltransferase
MGDSDLEFYTRKAYDEGDAAGYARATADARALIREYIALSKGSRMTMGETLAGVEVSLLRGLHVGKAKP